MNNSASQTNDEQTPLTFWQKHRFLMLIILVIMVSLFLVATAMSLYNSSGAAQVDLSRPDYETIRKEANADRDRDRESGSESFSATGDLTDAAFKKFNELYDARLKKVVGVDSFDEAALSEESLQLYAPAAE